MMDTPPAEKLVGLVPWHPWPLSAWRWWTVPVRAERLAVLRIGIALVMLVDIATTYAPAVGTFFGPGNMGAPDWFEWVRRSPRLSWSLLHGVGESQLSLLALLLFASTTAWLIFDHLGRCFSSRAQPAARLSLWVWLTAGSLFVAGVWSRELRDDDRTPLLWALPLAITGLSGLWLLLHAIANRKSELPNQGRLARGLLLLATLPLLAVGVWLALLYENDPESLVMRLLGPWNTDPQLLRLAMGAWVVSALLLLVGLGTRPAAFLAWALSVSFGNLNLYIDNAGDTVRCIILFHLMLCPCGAAWSIDAWWRGRNQPATIVMVSPWALRLLFVQMTLVYFLNGLYKLLGETWWSGETLYYVLGDIALARVPRSAISLPLWLLRCMTWSVLVWEVAFPLLMVTKWTRRLALVAGVAFHLGIFATMELGGFVPYMLCLYLPLLPWENWIGPRAEAAVSVTPP